MNKDQARLRSAASKDTECGRQTNSNGIDRREFIERLGAGAALAGIAATLGSVRGLADDTPKRGGHLVVGTDGASTTDSLDPTKFLGAFLPLVGFQLYDT